MTHDNEPATPPLAQPTGLLARQRILALTRTGAVSAAVPVDPGQLQPASLDLRLGSEAYRVRASFLPGPGAGVFGRLNSLNPEKISLQGNGAVLEKWHRLHCAVDDSFCIPSDDGRIALKLVHRIGQPGPRV